LASAHKTKAACPQAALFFGSFNAENHCQRAEIAHFSGVKSKDMRLKSGQCNLPVSAF
jgi:hypothetical protein